MIDISNYSEKLSKIIDISENLDEGKKFLDFVKEMKDNLDTLSNDNKVLKVGVVGQVKAGKSSFLNSLIFNGDNVLPKASTPMTAGLTVLQYSEENSFEVEYYSTREWDDFEGKAAMYRQSIEEKIQQNPGMSQQDARMDFESKPENAIYVSANELVSKCSKNAMSKISDIAQKDVEKFSDIKDLSQILENYVGANGEYTSVVKCLTINLNDERLKDIQIVDTPGVNDPVISREERTRKFLGECHGVFFLSFSGGFFDATDVDFLDNRIGANGIGSVVVVASKFDSALIDVAGQFNGDLPRANEHVQNVLRNQFNTNFNASQFKRQGGAKPSVVFSSGIGFAISHKTEAYWDEVERFTVKLMKDNYPDFFSTADDIRDNFDNLSSIDELREEYLEKKFKKNREKIIAEKSSRYLKTANSELKKRFESLAEMLSAKEESVKNASGADLVERRDAWLSICSTIIKELESVSAKIGSRAEVIEKDLKNHWNFDVSVSTLRHDNDTRFKYKGFGFLKISRQLKAKPYYLPVLSATKGELEKAYEKLDDLAAKWKEKCEPLADILNDTVKKAIETAEKDDVHGKLDARGLYNTVSETVEEMFNQTTMDISDVKQRFKNSVAQFVTDFEPRNDIKIDKVCENEDAGNAEIQRQASALKRDAQAQVNALTAQLASDVNTKLRESRESVLTLLTAKRSEMKSNIEHSAEEYLSELQKSIDQYQRNKEAEDAKYEKINQTINEIKQLI